jgi:hypothetical protein
VWWRVPFYAALILIAVLNILGASPPELRTDRLVMLGLGLIVAGLVTWVQHLARRVRELERDQ